MLPIDGVYNVTARCLDHARRSRKRREGMWPGNIFSCPRLLPSDISRTTNGSG